MPKVVESPYPICEDNMEQNLPTNVNPDACKLKESKQTKISDYQLESARLESFKNWPCVWVKPEKLAAAGFYYTGTDDKVKCFECQLEISELKLKDDPVTFHKQRSPKCRFIHGDSCDNVPKNVNPDTVPTVSRVGDVCGLYNSVEKSRSALEMKHPSYDEYDDRLASFDEWPKALSSLKTALAVAGFFYTSKGDRTTCYQCGLELKDWQLGVDPWERHVEFNRICLYLIRAKGWLWVANLVRKMERRRLSSTEGQEIVESSTSGTLGDQTEGTGNTCIASETPESAPSSESFAIESTETAESNRKRKLSVKSSTLGGEGLCKYCHVREIKMIFLPCLHMISCHKCVPKKCVKCGKPVKQSIRPIL